MSTQVKDIQRRGTRAAQPAASTALKGVTYYVTDEGKSERVKDDGSAWEDITCTTTASPHNLLDGTEHPDTLSGTVVRGDMIVGNSTPKWSRKAKGTSGQLWTMLDANDPGWADPPDLGGVSVVDADALQPWKCATLGFNWNLYTTGSGNFTVGHKILLWHDLTVAGVKFIWTSAGGAKSVKASIWDNGIGGSGTTLLDSKTISVAASNALNTATFTSPLSLLAQHAYTIGIYETSGAKYPITTSTNMPTRPFISGVIEYLFTNFFKAGDGRPDGGASIELYPVELVLG